MESAELQQVFEVDGVVEERGDQVGTWCGQVDRTYLGEAAACAEVEHPTDLAEVNGLDRLAPHCLGGVAPLAEGPALSHRAPNRFFAFNFFVMSPV